MLYVIFLQFPDLYPQPSKSPLFNNMKYYKLDKKVSYCHVMLTGCHSEKYNCVGTAALQLHVSSSVSKYIISETQKLLVSQTQIWCISCCRHKLHHRELNSHVIISYLYGTQLQAKENDPCFNTHVIMFSCCLATSQTWGAKMLYIH